MKRTWRTVVRAAPALVLVLGLSGCSWLFPPPVPEVPGVGFAPQASAVHTVVTVVGEGFGDAPTDVAVTFDGVEAPIVSWTDTNIVVRVPVLATPTGQRLAVVEVRQAGVLLGSGTFTVLRGILFESNRDGNSEIYVMNPDGTQPTNLTNDPDLDTFASWSPDGTKVAFVTTRDGNWEVYAMDADGSDATNLSDDPGADYFPVWSPNGTKIAFMTDREGGPPILAADPRLILPMLNVEIFVMDADGSDQKNLTDHIAWDGYPTWSPDGLRIAFETDRDDGGIVITGIIPGDLDREIYVMDSDGTDPLRLSNSPQDDVNPVWSPDGAKIAFESYRDGNAEIYVMNPDGTGQLRLTTHPDGDTMPGWSPNGNWITFHSQRDGNTEIYKMSSAGASLTRLTNALDVDWGPSWSPDGSQIVFQSGRDGNLEIYRMNADGTSLLRLTDDLGTDANPFWKTFGWALAA